MIVSDASGFDLAYLGSLGVVPGGAYREVVLPDCAHSPHLERPAEFVAELLDLTGVPAVGA